MFRIMCDPSSGIIELCLTEITLSGSQIFFVCLVGVWQRNFTLSVQRTAPQGSPSTPAECIAATTPGLIVRILKFWY